MTESTVKPGGMLTKDGVGVGAGSGSVVGVGTGAGVGYGVYVGRGVGLETVYGWAELTLPREPCCKLRPQ